VRWGFGILHFTFLILNWDCSDSDVRVEHFYIGKKPAFQQAFFYYNKILS